VDSSLSESSIRLNQVSVRKIGHVAERPTRKVRARAAGRDRRTHALKRESPADVPANASHVHQAADTRPFERESSFVVAVVWQLHHA